MHSLKNVSPTGLNKVDIEYYQVNAFTDQFNSGNPAAVCPLSGDTWLDDSLLQAIAKENNFSETAFYVRSGDDYNLRWFTPDIEVDLCGHATLAAATIFFKQHPLCETVNFNTRSGIINVSKKGARLCLDMPSWPAKPCSLDELILSGLDATPIAILKSNYYLLVFDNEDTVRQLKPNFDVIQKMDLWGMIVTAPSKQYDFVSRFFGSAATGIDEDPVTGSAHCILTPYWSDRLNKKELSAFQSSERGGELHCTLNDDRVQVSGLSTIYAQGHITI